MDRRFGYYILVGLLVGALLGVFLGWFIAAAAHEIRSKQTEDK